MYEICSELTIKMLELRQWRCSAVFIVNFEHYLTHCFDVSIEFEQVNVGWEVDFETLIGVLNHQKAIHKGKRKQGQHYVDEIRFSGASLFLIILGLLLLFLL